MSFERKKTLIEFCNTNTFTDSEDDTSDEENINDLSTNVITKQPGSNKITIIVDSSNANNDEEFKDEYEWENIEFAELDDLTIDDSFNINKKEKQM